MSKPTKQETEEVQAVAEKFGFTLLKPSVAEPAVPAKGIDPHPADIGRRVRYPRTGESGIITSYNDQVVFVRYVGSIQSQATKREDLEYE